MSGDRIASGDGFASGANGTGGGETSGVVVVGGGIAGVAASVALAERGVAVTLVEREGSLGGRAGAFPHKLASGQTVEMERGFHAFFRQYYTLRDLLRRVSPDLSILRPLVDYPVLGPHGQRVSFTGLPRRTPWNIVGMMRRTPELDLRALRHVDVRRAMAMLAYHPRRTTDRFDHLSAAEYLDSLRFPPEARRMLFEVFSHSFFNPEEDMSAAELLLMFHFYFVGNPEGLIFDVVRAPFSRAIWEPMGDYLRSLGVSVLTGTSVVSLQRSEGQWHAELSGGTARAPVVTAPAVVLALDVPGVRLLVERSSLAGTATGEAIRKVGVTNPFAVWRLYLDTPTAPHRAPFIGTAGHPLLDNISLFHDIEDESREWAARHGGSVVELHAYAVPVGTDEATIKRNMLAGLRRLYPETRTARVLDEIYLLRRDCPSFGPGETASRPGVLTAAPNLYLAGDYVRLNTPSALMERAALSGFLAANHILEKQGRKPHATTSIPSRGMLGALAA